MFEIEMMASFTSSSSSLDKFPRSVSISSMKIANRPGTQIFWTA